MESLDHDSEETLRTLEERATEAQQKRQIQCSELISLMKTSSTIRQHLQGIVTGQLSQSWQQKKQRAPIYFDDEKQLDEVLSFLSDIVSETPGDRQPDTVALIFDVLLPEVTIHSLAERNCLQMSEALLMFENGPQLEQCELDLIEIYILRNAAKDNKERDMREK